MGKPFVIIDRTLHEDAAVLLQEHAAVLVADTNNVPERLLQQAAALAIRTNTLVDQALLDRMPHLELVATATTGTNHIDRDACARRGVLVLDAKGANADSVADYVFRMLLAATDDACYANNLLKGDAASFVTIKKENCRRELGSLSLGIIGFGHIGSRVARRADAFGMKVRAFDPYVAQATNTLAEVLACNVVTVHAELTEETKGMISADQLRLLRDDVVFINAARGEIVDEIALVSLLQERPRMRAIVDVFADEPVPSPLYALPNCMVTPHIAGNAVEAKRRAARLVAERIIASLHPLLPAQMIIASEAHA